MSSAKRWLEDHRGDLPIILGPTLGLVLGSLLFRDLSGAVVGLAVGALFFLLYVVVNRTFDWWESR